MIDQGIVEVTTVKPHCVSPLGLVPKKLADGTEGYRLVFDASRCVNLHLESQHVSLAHLEKAVELTEMGDFQSTFDLSSCYYHIKIYPDHQRFLGASFIDENGEKKYFFYKHLPFGIASAVHVVTKLFKPILAFIHAQGIRFSIYIDDGRFLAGNMEQLELYRKIIYDTLFDAGWVIAKAKSDGCGVGAKRKCYLGFWIDSEKMMVEAKPEKLEKIKNMIQKKLGDSAIDVRELAKILGNIISLIPSHAFIARISSRSGYSVLAAHVEEFGWSGACWLSQEIKKEWIFCLENIFSRNGAPIRSRLNDVRVASLVENPVTKQERVSRSLLHSEIFISDASGFKVASFDLCDKKESLFTVSLTPEEMNCSSGMRELLAVEKTVKKWKASGEMRQKNVYWCTDSSNLVSFLSKGSGKHHIQTIVFEIAKDLSDLRSTITPIHLLRTDPRIQQADEASKVRDTDDWSIDEVSFAHLQNRFGFEIDLFASSSNKRCKKFYSEFYTQDCLGVEAFAQRWDEGMLWVCPPIKFLEKTAQRIRASCCKGVLLIPNWPTSSFFTTFIREGKFLWPFELVHDFYPFIIQNQNAESALKGKVVFKMFALYFDTSLKQVF